MGTIKIYPFNILAEGTTTVTGIPDTGYPEERLYDFTTELFWMDTVTEAKDIVIDQGGTIYDIDTLIIEGHNFDGIALQWQY